VVPRKLPALHPAPVVDDRQRRGSGVGEEADARRTRVERVCDDFREDRLLEGSSVCVPQVLEEVLEVNSRFADAGIVSPGGPSARPARVAPGARGGPIVIRWPPYG
jgi:hypothetical protein